MQRIDLALAEFNSGNLLSATQLTMLSNAVNALKGACAAAPPTFIKSGVDCEYWARRQFRYVHVRYDVFLSGGESCTMTIGGVAVNHSVSEGDYWRTFDLDAGAFGGPAANEWYQIPIVHTGDGTFFIEEIIESSNASPTGTGSYTAPPSFVWGDSAATFLSKLQQLRLSILSFTDTINPPSATFLRTTDSLHYTLRRRQDALVITYTSDGETDLDVYLYTAGGSQKIFGDEGDDRTFYTQTFLYGALTYPPTYNETMTLRFERNTGYLSVDEIGESSYALATYAPAWQHGYDTSAGASMENLLNQYSAIIADAYTRLGVVGWQYPCLHKPVDTPRWGMRKTKRYLHYKRDGSQPCFIGDPYGEYDDVSLSRTSTEPNLIKVHDLDSIDWLTYGRLFHVTQGEIMWLSDEP